MRNPRRPCTVESGWRRLSHALRYRAGVGNAVLLTAVAIVALVTLATGFDRDAATVIPYRTDSPWLWLLTAASVATLWWRRRRPVEAYGVATGILLVLDLYRYRDNVAFFVLLILMYHVGASVRGRRGWWTLAATATLLTTLLAVRPTVASLTGMGNGLAFLAGAWLLGRLVSAREARLGRRLRELQATAQLARREAELERVAERLRLAHELHDVIAHSISVVAVQAGVGQHLIGRDDAAAAAALDTIAASATSTLGELSSMMSNLYRGPAEADADSAGLAGPTLARVDLLVASFRAAGQIVEVRTAALPPVEVPAAASRVGYRLVQESLTNVLKHSRGAAAEVTVQVGPDGSLTLAVRNGPGAGGARPAPHDPGGGHGLRGMEERVARMGGTFRAGPTTDGFEVTATIPAASSPLSPTPLDARSDRTGDASTPVSASTNTGPDTGNGNGNGNGNGVARLGRYPQRAADLLLAGAFALVAVLSLVGHRADSPLHRPTAGTWLVTLGVVALLAWRRRHPLPILLVTLTALAYLAYTGQESGVLTGVVVLLIYAVACYRTVRQTWAGLAASLGLSLAVTVWRPVAISLTDIVNLSLFIAGAAAVGWMVRCRRERLQTEVHEAEVSADAAVAAARLSLAAERLHLAGELHDRVSRTLQVIAAEAGEARLGLDRSPEAAEAALGRIAAISRTTLNELRALLAGLREVDGGSVAYRPGRQLSDLTDLVGAGSGPAVGPAGGPAPTGPGAPA